MARNRFVPNMTTLVQPTKLEKTAFRDGIEYLKKHWDRREQLLPVGICHCGQSAFIEKDALPTLRFSCDSHSVHHARCKFGNLRSIHPALGRLSGDRKLLRRDLALVLHEFQHRKQHKLAFARSESLSSIKITASLRKEGPGNHALPDGDVEAYAELGGTERSPWLIRFYHWASGPGLQGHVKSIARWLLSIARLVLGIYQGTQLVLELREAMQAKDSKKLLRLIRPLANQFTYNWSRDAPPVDGVLVALGEVLDMENIHADLSDLHETVGNETTAQPVDAISLSNLEALEEALELR